MWSPDSSRIVYTSYRAGGPAVYQKMAGGAGTEQPLGKLSGVATDWSRDGRYLLYSTPNHKIWVLPAGTGKEAEGKPFPFLQTEFQHRNGQFSPDGKWVAYASDESKRNEVYVQSFPAGSAKWQISTAGGSQPRWRRDGKELFYLAPGNSMMAVPVKTGTSFEPGVPAPLFQYPNLHITATFDGFDYVVSGDGRRFLMAGNASDQTKPQPVTVVVNWLADGARSK